MSQQRVVVVGASPKPERYSYKAIQQLLAHDHLVRGAHPRYREVLERAVFPTVREAGEDLGGVDTVTLYVNPDLSNALVGELLELGPKRVIFNPGTENPKLVGELEQAGIETLEACTLVLLSTGQF